MQIGEVPVVQEEPRGETLVVVHIAGMAPVVPMVPEPGKDTYTADNIAEGDNSQKRLLEMVPEAMHQTLKVWAVAPVPRQVVNWIYDSQ